MGAMRRLVGYKGKYYRADSPELKVARGDGRMVDGAYQDYTATDKTHMNDANANRDAQYQDVSQNSGLGRNWGDGIASLLGNVKKKKQAGASGTLLGNTVVGGKQSLGG